MVWWRYLALLACLAIIIGFAIKYLWLLIKYLIKKDEKVYNKLEKKLEKKIKK